MSVISGFLSDLSITRKSDGNFGGCFVFQSRVSTKTVVKLKNMFYTAILPFPHIGLYEKAIPS